MCPLCNLTVQVKTFALPVHHHLAIALAVAVSFAWPGPTGRAEILHIRGTDQTVHLYGTRGAEPIVVSSGDGGWVHLGPHVAEILASKGFFVVGFDTRAYLASFTSGKDALRTEDEPADYRTLAAFAAKGTSQKPILVGVSLGAGLSILAAADPNTKAAMAGIVALGLPDINELAWRWRDSVIYVTHGVPNEPTFSTAAVIDQVAPLPLAAIHSNHDEFISAARAQEVFERARDPKKLWIVSASNHRFSDNSAEFERRLIEAIEWVKENSPR